MSTADINPDFLDVDFSQDPRWSMGCKGPGNDPPLCASFGDVLELIPESKWKELAMQLEAEARLLSNMVSRIFDQEQEGSCVANATGQAAETIQGVMFGKSRVISLSPISLYKRIGDSPDSGAFVGDALTEMQKRGILPLDTPENREKFGDHVMPHTGFHERYPQGWEETAARFNATKWVKIKNRQELITSLFRRYPVIVGRQGHSICYMDPLWRNGKLVVKYANSWTPEWGDGGFGYDSMRQIDESAGSYAWALLGLTYGTHQNTA